MGTGGCEGGGGGVCVWKEVEGLKDERARGKREEKRFFPRSGLSESRTAMLGGGVIPGQVEMGEYYRKRRPDHLAVAVGRTNKPKTPATYIPTYPDSWWVWDVELNWQGDGMVKLFLVNS